MRWKSSQKRWMLGAPLFFNKREIITVNFHLEEEVHLPIRAGKSVQMLRVRRTLEVLDWGVFDRWVHVFGLEGVNHGSSIAIEPERIEILQCSCREQVAQNGVVK